MSNSSEAGMGFEKKCGGCGNAASRLFMDPVCEDCANEYSNYAVYAAPTGTIMGLDAWLSRKKEPHKTHINLSAVAMQARINHEILQAHTKSPKFISPEAKADATVETPFVRMRHGLGTGKWSKTLTVVNFPTTTDDGAVQYESTPVSDPTRAAVELEMSETMIRKYRELKQLVWKHAKNAMQRQYSAWPWCGACSQPKKLQAELSGGSIVPAFSCPCGTTFVKPYGAPVDLVRRAATLGNPQVVCGEQDGAK